MYCIKCGQLLQDDANFCHRCGSRAFQPADLTESSIAQAGLQAPDAIPESAAVLEEPETGAPEETGLSLAAMLCGILGVSLFWIMLPGVVLGLVALVFGFRSIRKYPEVKRGQAVAGVILGITAIALSVLMISQIWGNPNFFLSLSGTDFSRL